MRLESNINKRAEDISLDDIEISFRTCNFLKNVGIKNLGDIISHELDFYIPKNVPGFGVHCKEELKKLIKEKKLKFKNEL